MMRVMLSSIICMLILLGCISVPIPTSEQNTLVVGKFLVNWNTTNKMSGGNGKYKFGIRFYFQDDQSGEIFSILTQKDGWLFMSQLGTGGHYTITKLFIEHQEENALYQMTLNGPFPITIEEGKVNNLGVVQIDLGNSVYGYKLVDYDSVKYDFQIDFPDSEWNGYEWENINGFTYPIRSNSGNIYD